MPRATTIIVSCTGFALAALAAGWGVRAASVDRPACQPTGEDPAFVDHPDLNQNSPQCFISPDGHKVAVVRGGIITVRKSGEAFRVGATEQGRILWNSASDGFVVADSEGSGQTEVFSFVDLAPHRPLMVKRLRETATDRYRAAFSCRGSKWFANTIMSGWTPTGDVRLVVQDGVHSEGCMPHGEMIGVVGDPRTGAISRVLSANQVRGEWCGAAERRQFGYCYNETEGATARR